MAPKALLVLLALVWAAATVHAGTPAKKAPARAPARAKTAGAAKHARKAGHGRKAAKARRHRARQKLPPLVVPPSVAWRYFHPAWAHHDESDRVVHELVGDPSHRLDPALRVPEYLSDRVSFWIGIYARYPSHVRVIHDRDTPSVVYGHLDLSPVLREPIGPGDRERKIRGIEKAVIAELKSVITDALAAGHGGRVTGEARARLRRILAPLSVRTAADVDRALGSIRTQTGQSDVFQAALARGRQLLPEAEAVFRRVGLPVGLARIPFVESSFNASARSKAGAVGIWQLTPVAARDTLSKKDRKHWHDTSVQTLAAARLLARYRHVLPDWATTVTAYNVGVGTIHRLTRASGARSFKDLLDSPRSRRPLGFAGRNFYSEFLAVSLIEAYKTRVFVPGLIDGEPVTWRRDPATFTSHREPPEPVLATFVPTGAGR